MDQTSRIVRVAVPSSGDRSSGRMFDGRKERYDMEAWEHVGNGLSPGQCRRKLLMVACLLTGMTRALMGR